MYINVVEECPQITPGADINILLYYCCSLTFSFLFETLDFLPSACLLPALFSSPPASSWRNSGASRASTAPSSLMSCKQASETQ